jgi:hypothetical protein
MTADIDTNIGNTSLLLAFEEEILVPPVTVAFFPFLDALIAELMLATAPAAKSVEKSLQKAKTTT